MNIHEYQAQGGPQGVRRAGAARQGRRSRRRGGGTPREELGGPVWVGEDRRSTPAAAARASSRRRTPATRAACASPSRSTRSRPTSARCSARRWSRPDRRRPASRSTASTSRKAPTSPRVLPLGAGRPRDRAASPSSSRPKAAWTSRRSPTTRRRRSSPSRSIRRPASCRITAAPSRSALGLTGDLAKQAGDLVGKLYTAFVAEGHEHARDQPADRHQGRASSSASTPRSASIRTRSTATPTSSPCAT